MLRSDRPRGVHMVLGVCGLRIARTGVKADPRRRRKTKDPAPFDAESLK